MVKSIHRTTTIYQYTLRIFRLNNWSEFFWLKSISFNIRISSTSNKDKVVIQITTMIFPKISNSAWKSRVSLFENYQIQLPQTHESASEVLHSKRNTTTAMNWNEFVEVFDLNCRFMLRKSWNYFTLQRDVVAVEHEMKCWVQQKQVSSIVDTKLCKWSMEQSERIFKHPQAVVCIDDIVFIPI